MKIAKRSFLLWLLSLLAFFATLFIFRKEGNYGTDTGFVIMLITVLLGVVFFLIFILSTTTEYLLARINKSSRTRADLVRAIITSLLLLPVYPIFLFNKHFRPILILKLLMNRELKSFIKSRLTSWHSVIFFLIRKAFAIVLLLINGILWFFGYILIYYLLFIGSGKFPQPFYVNGKSMEPTFTTEDYIGLYSNFANKFDPKRGDIVVFETKNEKKELVDFLKRVITVEGDEIKITDGDVCLNGKILKEPYILKKKSTFTYEGGFVKEGKIYIVPKDSIFVMGDNREISHDSRDIGYIQIDKIKGLLSTNKQKKYVKPIYVGNCN